MGEIFLPIAYAVAGGLEKIFGFLSDHPILAKFAAVVLVLASAMALVVGPTLIFATILPQMTIGLGLMSTALGTGTVGLVAFGTAIKVALGPIGLIIAALSILGGIVIAKLDLTIEDATASLDDFNNMLDITRVKTDNLNDSLVISTALLDKMITLETGTRKFEREVGFGTSQDLGRVTKLDIERALTFSGPPVTVNIGTVQGLNGTEISKSLNEELKIRGI